MLYCVNIKNLSGIAYQLRNQNLAAVVGPFNFQSCNFKMFLVTDLFNLLDLLYSQLNHKKAFQ